MPEVVPFEDSLAPSTWESTSIDTSKAHPARIYNYFLGGKDNYAVDREAAETALRAVPEVRAGARANRAFLGRAVRNASMAGITQFLDLGTGIPGPGNTGDIARSIHPEARVVYVDNDPIVATHSRALLSGADPALTAILEADIRDPTSILDDPTVAKVLDFQRPIAVLMVALLHFIRDEEDPAGVLATFTDAVAPGSMLVLSHATRGSDPERAKSVASGWTNATSQLVMRSVPEVTQFLDRWSVLEPGLVQVPQWRPDGDVPEGSELIQIYGAVGVKP
ncbi:SAM-dependent methyltransferase [Catenulispora rubra]|uniref:SAM-dependent methyltransferase n=1 Tax=Catenulispora rubra TaxID=280293 RepID=UPI001892183C|nr:SAM-dependent methyltransferase [Catenulispora rubra]